MIVVDTSVWVDHFRRPQPDFQALILEGQIALHPYVYGELLLGGLPSSGQASDELLELAPCPMASALEAAAFIGWTELTGTGIGYVDAHLLLSARLMSSGRLLTTDKSLRTQAIRLGVAFDL